MTAGPAVAHPVSSLPVRLASGAGRGGQGAENDSHSPGNLDAGHISLRSVKNLPHPIPKAHPPLLSWAMAVSRQCIKLEVTTTLVSFCLYLWLSLLMASDISLLTASLRCKWI